MSKALLVLIVALGIVGIVVVLMIPPTTYPVSGHVFICSPVYPGSPAGVPVPGVMVTFTKDGVAYSALTDFDGAFSVNLPAGMYAVHGQRELYSTYSGTLLVDGPISAYNEVCVVAMATG